MPGAPFPVGEEPVAVVPAPSQGGEAAAGGGVRHRPDDLLAVFAGVGELDGAGPAAGVPAQQRGEAVAVVQFGVAVAADAEEAEVEQAHGRGQHPLPGQSAVAQMAFDGLPHRGQHLGDVEHVLVLGLLLLGAELRVVQVLAASGGVGAHGLQVPVGTGADPHVAPGRRDDQLPDPGQLRGVAQRFPPGAEVPEAAPVPQPTVPGVRGAAVVETHPGLLFLVRWDPGAGSSPRRRPVLGARCSVLGARCSAEHEVPRSRSPTRTAGSLVRDRRPGDVRRAAGLLPLRGSRRSCPSATTFFFAGTPRGGEDTPVAAGALPTRTPLSRCTDRCVPRPWRYGLRPSGSPRNRQDTWTRPS